MKWVGLGGRILSPSFSYGYRSVWRFTIGSWEMMDQLAWTVRIYLLVCYVSFCMGHCDFCAPAGGSTLSGDRLPAGALSYWGA